MAWVTASAPLKTKDREVVQLEIITDLEKVILTIRTIPSTWWWTEINLLSAFHPIKT
jgi:hypothetical protein